MPDPNQSAPPSFYNNMAQMGTGAGAAPPGGPPGAGGPPGGPPGGDDSEIMAAVSKIAGAVKKIGKMKDGAQPYADRIMGALKELVVDVFKKDPKELDAAGGAPGGDAKPPTDNPTPPPPPGLPTPPPPPGAPA